MEKKEAEQKQISIYWWNMGTKTLDFEGNYKDYLKRKNIKIRKSLGNYQAPLLNFNISLSSSRIKFITAERDYVIAFTQAIILFLTQLGDKTLFVDGYNREYQINWR